MNTNLKVHREAKLLEFLFEQLHDTKKTRVRQFLQHGCVSVNSRITTKFDHPLQTGDQVRIETSKQRALTPQAQFNIEIVYEDDVLLVINKPAGMLSIATDKVPRETAIFAANDYLNKKAQAVRRNEKNCKRVFVVHRIDRDVSGLLLLAKNEQVKFQLQENWADVTKEYLGVTEGCPEKDSGFISSYLTENKILQVESSSRALSPESKQAVTHYEVMKAGKKSALVKIRLETGRKHQIRVHLRDLGCPLVGDKIYGAHTNPIGRIALHAWRLSFTHPVTQKIIDLISELPAPLERLTNQSS